MRFGANNQLSVEPMIDLFQQAVSQALLSAGDSVIQVTYAFSSIAFTLPKLEIYEFIMFLLCLLFARCKHSFI